MTRNNIRAKLFSAGLRSLFWCLGCLSVAKGSELGDDKVPVFFCLLVFYCCGSFGYCPQVV